MDIVEFLSARYAEEAKRWQTIWRFKAGDHRIDGYWDLGGTFGRAVNTVIDTTHGGRELAAKRRRLELFAEQRTIVENIGNHPESFTWEQAQIASGIQAGLEVGVRLDAAVYGQHADYNPAWQVEQ